VSFADSHDRPVSGSVITKLIGKVGLNEEAQPFQPIRRLVYLECAALNSPALDINLQRLM